MEDIPYELFKATGVHVLKRDPMVGWWADHVAGKSPKEALENLLRDQQTFEP